MNYVTLFLTCSSTEEANSISKKLLEKRLISCAKQLPVSASFLWEGSFDTASEILLIMESAEELCQEIEATVRTLHSYDTFVLTALPMVFVSERAQAWLKETLKSA